MVDLLFEKKERIEIIYQLAQKLLGKVKGVAIESLEHIFELV